MKLVYIGLSWKTRHKTCIICKGLWWSRILLYTIRMLLLQVSKGDLVDFRTFMYFVYIGLSWKNEHKTYIICKSWWKCRILLYTNRMFLGPFFVKSATHGSDHLRFSPTLQKYWPYLKTRNYQEKQFLCSPPWGWGCQSFRKWPKVTKIRVTQTAITLWRKFQNSNAILKDRSRPRKNDDNYFSVI